MKTVKQILPSAMLAISVLALTASAEAQIQTTGTPGSASATTTISGKQLPPPEPKFGGVIKETYLDSTPWWPPRVVPPKGAPNVALKRTVDTYRRDLWASQDYYVEVWVEKDAIAGIVGEIADSYGVQTFVCRGFSSLTGIYEASESFAEMKTRGKTPLILYFGDYDPSGKEGAAFIERSLRDDFECDAEFRIIGVTAEQITEFNLPTRPTKTSTHSKNWTGGESVEIDAMSSEQIQTIVQDAIVGLIDPDEWAALRKIEQEERKTLQRIASRFRRAA